MQCRVQLGRDSDQPSPGSRKLLLALLSQAYLVFKLGLSLGKNRGQDLLSRPIELRMKMATDP